MASPNNKCYIESSMKTTTYDTKRLVLPYVKSTSEPISMILKKFNFTTIFKPVKSIKNFLFIS